MKAAQKYNIDVIWASVWTHGSASYHTSLCGLNLFAEFMYNDDNIVARTKENFEFMTKGNYDAMMDMSQFHNILDGRKYENWWDKYKGKRFLFQDLMAGVGDYDLDLQPMAEHYRKYADKLATYINSDDGFWNKHYIRTKIIFEILVIKCEIGENLRSIYAADDRTALAEIADVKIPKLQEYMRKLREMELEYWYSHHKPQGGEMIDIRLSGLIGRAETVAKRINKYLDGEITELPEIEQDRLYFSSIQSEAFTRITSMGC